MKKTIASALTAFVMVSCSTEVSKTTLSVVTPCPTILQSGTSYYVDYGKEVTNSSSFVFIDRFETNLDSAIKNAVKAGGNNCIGLADAKVLYLYNLGFNVTGKPIYKQP